MTRNQRISLAALTSLTMAANVSCSRGTAAAAPNATRAVTVAVAKIARRNLSRKLVVAAEFRPFQEINVHAKVAGYVKSIDVDVGDRVRKGQLLAVLEIPELQNELGQAEAAVKEREEEVRRAESEHERAESAHQVAHLAYTRLAAIGKAQPKLVAQQDLDDAEGRDRVAEAQAATARAAQAVAREQLEMSKANREKAATLLAYSRITAPFSGVITQRYADTGSMIQAGTASQSQAMPLVKLSQNDRLRLIIPVPESAVPRIRPGTVVDVDVPVLSRTFQGTVARSADKLDPATRTLQTEVDVPNPRLELVPGMYANAAISLEDKRGVPAAPVQALSRRGDQVFVFRVTHANVLEERQITVGLETPTEIEILSGIKENDLVVVGGLNQLRSGEKVEPKAVDLPAARGEA